MGAPTSAGVLLLGQIDTLREPEGKEEHAAPLEVQGDGVVGHP